MTPNLDGALDEWVERYRGLEENGARLFAQLALVNLALVNLALVKRALLDGRTRGTATP